MLTAKRILFSVETNRQIVTRNPSVWLAMAIAASTWAATSAQDRIRQIKNDYIAFEAEHAFAFVTGDPAAMNGWRIVDAGDNQFNQAQQGAVILTEEVASNTSGGAAIYDIPGGNVETDYVHWFLQFSSPGDYSLYLKYTMYEATGDGGYGNENSIYVSSSFGKNVELLGTDADPTGNRDQKPSYYGNLPTGGEWEGNWSWWNATPDGSDATTSNVDGIYTPDVGEFLDFGIATREDDVAIDVIVFHKNPNLDAAALDALTLSRITHVDYMPGDYNSDGNVNLDDFNIMAAYFNRSFSIFESFEKGDETRDGRVDLRDFVTARQVFNSGDGALAVPEPASFDAFCLGFLHVGILLRRRGPSCTGPVRSN